LSEIKEVKKAKMGRPPHAEKLVQCSVMLPADWLEIINEIVEKEGKVRSTFLRKLIGIGFREQYPKVDL